MSIPYVHFFMLGLDSLEFKSRCSLFVISGDEYKLPLFSNLFS
ncbi:hypothetical protein VN0787_09820 [Helicobacter pylori]|nr:hypothetical protein VN0431_08560 [Helicobacter pylori]